MAVPIATKSIALESSASYNLLSRVTEQASDVLKLSIMNIPGYSLQGQSSAGSTVVTEALPILLQQEVDSLKLQNLPLEKYLEMLKLLLHGIDETAPLATQESVLKACQERLVPTQQLILHRKKMLLEKLEAYEQGCVMLKRLQALSRQHCQRLNLKKELLQKEQALDATLADRHTGCMLDKVPITRSRIVAQEAALDSQLSQNAAIRHHMEHEEAVVCSLRETCDDYEEIIAQQRLQLEATPDRFDASLIKTAVTSIDRTAHATALCYLRSVLCQGKKLLCTFGAKDSPCELTVDFARASNSGTAIITSIEVNPMYLLSNVQLNGNFIGTPSFFLLVITVLQQWSSVAPLATEISVLRESFALDWQPEQDPHIIRVILGKKGNMATLKVPYDYCRGGLVSILSVSGCDAMGIEVPCEKRARVSTTVQFLAAELARRI